MKAWQFSNTSGGIEKNLKINLSAPLPTPKSDQSLVQVIACAVNPVDHKLLELPFVGRFLVSTPATPGVDIAARIITPAANSPFKRDDLVFGMSGTGSAFGAGGLAEFAICETKNIAALPRGVDPVDAAGVGVAGITAYQSIVPRVKRGDKVFINGGSGGTGTFGIQIAKAVGCFVATSCSSANVELCKSLGADEVIDYKKGNIVDALKDCGPFDHVVDNVGSDDNLYTRCHEYTRPGAVYITVGGDPSLSRMLKSLRRKLLRSNYDVDQRKREGFWPKPNTEDFQQIGEWMKAGKVKTVIDRKFGFEEAPQAFERLKTGRSRGKVLVDVASETYTKNSI